MLVSIIIPVYNGQKTLKKCLESIKNQTYKDIEVILVNDGSTDLSKEICEEYCRNDCRFKLINKKNEGAGPTRNLGIENANGDYIMFPDCDDWVDESYVEELLQNVIKYNSELAICRSRNYYSETQYIEYEGNNDNIKYFGEKTVRENYITLLVEHLILGPSDKIYNLKIIKENNIRFPNIRRSQDIMFNIEYIKKCNRVIIINKSLYNYNLPQSNQKTKKLPDNYFDIMMLLLNTWDSLKNEWGGDTHSWNCFIGEYALREVYSMISMCLNSRNLNNREFITHTLNNEILMESIKKYNPKKIDQKVFKNIVMTKNYILIVYSVKLMKYVKNILKRE